MCSTFILIFYINKDINILKFFLKFILIYLIAITYN